MRYYLTIFCAIFFATPIFADMQKIVAVVNDDPITLQEFQARRRMEMYFNNISHITQEQELMLDSSTLDSLIDEQILCQQEKKLGIKISDLEVDDTISEIEKRNKMSNGHIASNLRARNIDPTTFRRKVQSELLKRKLVSEMLSRNISVSQSEVDSAILDSNSKDADINMKILTAKDNSEKSYQQMVIIGKKLTNCSALSSKLYQEIAEISDINNKLSALPPQIQATIKDLSNDEHSDVIKVGDSFKIFLICNKKIENFTDNENNYVINVLSNKKLILKARKYQEDLRKKAYIKILI